MWILYICPQKTNRQGHLLSTLPPNPTVRLMRQVCGHERRDSASRFALSWNLLEHLCSSPDSVRKPFTHPQELAMAEGKEPEPANELGKSRGEKGRRNRGGEKQWLEWVELLIDGKLINEVCGTIGCNMDYQGLCTAETSLSIVRVPQCILNTKVTIQTIHCGDILWFPTLLLDNFPEPSGVCAMVQCPGGTRAHIRKVHLSITHAVKTYLTHLATSKASINPKLSHPILCLSCKNVEKIFRVGSTQTWDHGHLSFQCQFNHASIYTHLHMVSTIRWPRPLHQQ